MKNIALILASGTGKRSGLDIPKQFFIISGKTVLEHSIEIFETHDKIDEIILVSHGDYIDKVKEIVKKNNYKKITKIISGGATRQESSYIGVNAIPYFDAKVLIHDAVRPFTSADIITECINALNKYKAVDVAVAASDTLVKINSNNIIEEIPERRFYMRSQTPQCFDLKIIKRAHELANNSKDLVITDDCGLINQFKLCDIYIVKGNEFNIKITYPEDIAIAEKIYELKNGCNHA